MNWILWTSFATVSIVNIVTPGPANLNTVRRAVQLGGARVIPTIAGNALGLAVGGAVCAAGIASFVLASEILWMLFHWLGVGYLAWLGCKLLTKAEVLALDEAPQSPVGAKALFMEAFLLAATNPKALLFYMALFPQTLDPQLELVPQASILVLTYCALSVASLSTYSALAHMLRNRFMTQTRYNRFRQLSGVVLLGFAGKLLLGSR
ncbi:LysE family translocator [Stappia taiwanensis]|uniref:LysE family translocator n=1 Tax=Stappia taiwanensis TaxID=992267 RepID=A0A838XX64_9HYPH|nr:LysE family translocator [Stappia taiwanensis]MBA4611380.1 LysE family translocator [Stappia taiwanensis]GGF00776.1 flagellar biosynthesis protein FlgM [Stappia taiwanensis]